MTRRLYGISRWRSARHPQRAKPHNATRNSGPCDAAPLFRGRPARLGIGRAPAGECLLTTNAEHSRSRQGAQGTMPSALEGNCCRPPRLAGSTGIGPRPELFVNAEAAAMTRAGFEYILDKHACAATKSCASLSGRPCPPINCGTAAPDHAPGHTGHPKVALWLGHADIRTTEIYLRVDPSENWRRWKRYSTWLASRPIQGPDALIASLFEHIVRRERRKQASPCGGM